MFILKAGGGKNINWEYIAKDLADLKRTVIIIHGANAWMTDIAAKLGIPQQTLLSPSGHTSRYTDSSTMELLTMVYSGLINKRIVAALQRYGIHAVGLCGADGRIWRGKRKGAILAVENGKTKLIKSSLTGTVEGVNTDLLGRLIDGGYTPVLTIPAITENGELINVDNDRALAVMVRDLGVKEVVILIEAPGLLAESDDQRSLIATVNKTDIDRYIDQTAGRMRKKLLGIKEAFQHGVQKVIIADGRVEQPVSKAFAGKGTVIS